MLPHSHHLQARRWPRPLRRTIGLESSLPATTRSLRRTRPTATHRGRLVPGCTETHGRARTVLGERADVVAAARRVFGRPDPSADRSAGPTVHPRRRRHRLGCAATATRSRRAFKPQTHDGQLPTTRGRLTVLRAGRLRLWCAHSVQSSARTRENSYDAERSVSSVKERTAPSSPRSPATRPRSVTKYTVPSPLRLRASRYVRSGAPLEMKSATLLPV